MTKLFAYATAAMDVVVSSAAAAAVAFDVALFAITDFVDGNALAAVADATCCQLCSSAIVDAAVGIADAVANPAEGIVYADADAAAVANDGVDLNMSCFSFDGNFFRLRFSSKARIDSRMFQK